MAKPGRKKTGRSTGAHLPLVLAGRLAELGWTQAEFARRVGVASVLAWSYMHGKMLPSPQRIKRICSLLHLEPQALLIGRASTAAEVRLCARVFYLERKRRRRPGVAAREDLQTLIELRKQLALCKRRERS